MGTYKKRVSLYVGSELEKDLDVLYKLWEVKMRNRGLVPNRNMFYESIMKKFCNDNRPLIGEYRLMMAKEVNGGMKKSVDGV